MSQFKQASLVGLVVCGLFFGNAFTQEYTRIKSRIETTQAKADALADELKATTKTIHAAIKSITDRLVSESVQASEQPQLQPKIVMHSADSCGPCRAWIVTEKAKWQKAGWDVQIIKETTTKRGWPWYEITDRDGRFEVVGPLTSDKFIAAKKAVK